ncbi:UNKNOWN [Stylonychia lemnae]|uniref:Uncharacterized protein n=1 Tax=Stylonychia lemnae TaxID=5949 RepID=A0A078A5T7_STYLE|nr:UNKNOWN [Stylonychia lemnae]|eukprot:CDW77610.1 UNKNOWN [Stylonychia lemnae]
MDPMMNVHQLFEKDQVYQATTKLRKMTIQEESSSLQHPIQMPKTPYIKQVLCPLISFRPNTNIPLIRSPFTLPKSQVLQVTQYKPNQNQPTQSEDQANQSTFETLESSSYESPFRLVSWQTVLQECDDEYDETPTQKQISQNKQIYQNIPSVKNFLFQQTQLQIQMQLERGEGQ